MSFLALAFLIAANPQIRLPAIPTPPPPPAINPLAPAKLDGECLYIIDSSVDCIVLASPAGLVSIAKDQGPIRIRGKFVDGQGKVETRTYKGPFVYVVDAKAAGTCELIVVPIGVKAEADIVRRIIEVNLGPRPPPAPPEPPAPTVGKLRVAFIYQRGVKLPPAQQTILTSTIIHEYMHSHALMGPDGKTPEVRYIKTDDDLSGEDEVWRNVMARPRASVPWIVVSNGKDSYEGPLPGSVSDTIALLKKYGGP